MNQADKQYCQSCGMPLRFDVEEYMGTNSDHSRSDEYCYYCLKDGDYTVDILMSEMVDIWVKYTDKYNWYSHTNYTPQELRTLLNKRLPTLKRWRQKEETESLHYKAVNRIKVHIDKNLFAALTPEQLAARANLSFFHFRKVFRNTTGENIGTYIQRLRLEYVAHLLISTDQSISDIQQQTNYETKFSLAKAFKKHFGISMSNYRTKYQSVNTSKISDNLPKPEIRRINTLNAICLDVNGAFKNAHSYQAIWKQLKHYKEKHLVKTNSHFISISQDNPQVTLPDLRRLYIGFITNEYAMPEGKFTLQEISGGMYAVFTHKGSYSQLPNLYKTIHEQWLPYSRYIQKHPLSFEVYLNTPDEVIEENLITEIYIPIDNK
ncbi:GyrI-like domain-containing protein [Bacteroidales bacterium OttesenSCG-928-M06]|nr:GyrI-like domain-containing protein [Bacteroidales bacterium OttesenSCG-928-M06]